MQATALDKKQKTLFRNTNFMLLFLGGLVSRIGNGIHYIGLVWYILELKGSGFAVGMVLMLSTLPGVILGPFSGVLVDRYNRKKIIVWMDIVRGLITLLMGLMVLSQAMNYTYLILGTVLLGVCGTLFNPAVSASIPNIVEDQHLTKANSFEHMSMNLTGVIGPAFGGILLAIYGVAGVFIINGLSFLLSAFSEAFIKFPPRKITQNGGKADLLREMKEGAIFIYHNKALFHLMFACLFANFLYSGTFVVGMPLIAKKFLDASAQEFGMMQAAWPVGAALGGLLISVLSEFKKIFKVFTISLSIQTIFFFMIGIVALPLLISQLGITRAMILIIGLLVLGGVCNAFVNIPILVVFQRMIPDDKRGRIFALTGTISQGLVPISIGLAGLISEIIIPAYLFIFGGIGMVFIMFNLVQKKEARAV